MTTVHMRVDRAQETLAGHKQAAAERAVDWVESGMVVGLGSGSTALFAIRCIGALIQARTLRDVLGVPTSIASEMEARRLNIPIAEVGWRGPIDVTIDGADEVDPALDLIKGGGGALLREKIVAQASRREVIVVDETKLSPRLGTGSSVPVEVIAFGWRSQAQHLESLGARVSVRSHPDGTPFATDEGNLILDCAFGPVARPAELAAAIGSRAGIVEHGLFLGLATNLIVAGVNGITHRSRT
jgi:ribose 5-phosphate isomerase A